MQEYHWYMVQIYSMQVEKMINNIKKVFDMYGQSHLINEIFVPTTKYNVFKNGKINEKSKLTYGGYIAIKMLSTQNEGKIEAHPDVSKTLSRCSGVVKLFKKPLTEQEYQKMKESIEKQHENVAKKNDTFMVGSNVSILSGSLRGFGGVVEKIEDNDDKIEYTVKVKIFDQYTSVKYQENEISLDIETPKEQDD
jgi:transcription antitermination factor NusG